MERVVYLVKKKKEKYKSKSEWYALEAKKKKKSIRYIC